MTTQRKATRITRFYRQFFDFINWFQAEIYVQAAKNAAGEIQDITTMLKRWRTSSKAPGTGRIHAALGTG
jgi:hypothetical protein